MLSRLKTGIYSRFVEPNLVRRGWKQARGTPIGKIVTPGLGPLFGYDDEERIREAAQFVCNYTMTSYERLATLWQQVQYLDHYGIEGDFVECGVWKGGSVGMMALAHKSSCSRPQRKIHLFDSFEGLPEPKPEDGKKAETYAGKRKDGKLESIHKCVGPLEVNKELMESRIGYPTELLDYHVGWFENTVPQVAPNIGKIALLRLDGDWYESTKVCLDHLYSKVVRGGVIVIDDYGHWEGCRKAVDEFLAASKEPVLLNHIDYTARYWVKLS